MSGVARYSRLRWLCRRGMKELDVLLEAFLEKHHDALVQGAYPELEDLLASEDDLLWDWLQLRKPAPKREWSSLVALIRDERG